ncbi:MAG TPA: hypothetical protein VG056_02045 [Pirellulales bacterium]|jgi:hypothetical protein|nr:hypothetical protein [Pirellulales bacterium]
MLAEIFLFSRRTSPPGTAACLAICALFAALSGCTHIQLRNNSVNQAAAVGDFQQQQVLDNLAMFVFNINSFPHFSYPNQSGSTVTDQGVAGLTPGWGRPITSGATAASHPPRFGDFLLSSLGLNLNAQRSEQEGFTITPINDPKKLELMRCAYQEAVASCGCGAMSRNCPDCQARLNSFYTGDPEGKISQSGGGSVTTDCLKGKCWFHVGRKHDVPDSCCCNYVGHYCDTYVWVLPDGRDELTKLTLVILDFALNGSPVKRTKEVVYYIDELGLPTTIKDSVGKVTAQVAVTEHDESVLASTPQDAFRIKQILEGDLQNAQKRLAAATDPTERKAFLDEQATLERKLEFLEQQIKVGTLKEEYLPGSFAPSPPFSVIPGLQLQQNTLGSPTTLPNP